MKPTSNRFFYRGQSMTGTFRPGDILNVAPTQLEGLHSGDIIIYHKLSETGPGHKVVHRILRTVPGGVIARGDFSPPNAMDVVLKEDIIGRVVSYERHGKRRSVTGRWRGRLRSQFLARWYPFHRNVRRGLRPVLVMLLRKPYRTLRASGFVSRFWKPTIIKVTLESPKGKLVKYICGKRTIARWYPAQGVFYCSKPYDLVVKHPDGRWPH